MRAGVIGLQLALNDSSCCCSVIAMLTHSFRLTMESLE
ncbi:MAG: hypothetical protein ACJAWS_003007 [Oleiphilaceae bacterium]|jgi:hypothetical protein